jgi:hypothetical protein
MISIILKYNLVNYLFSIITNNIKNNNIIFKYLIDNIYKQSMNSINNNIKKYLKSL